MKSGVFITGTDTGVGKTMVSAMLLASVRAHWHCGRYFKPIQTGREDDSRRVARLTGLPVPDRIQPLYQFRLSAAPSQAAASENTRIELNRIFCKWKSISQQEPWIIEGAGGVLVPLNRRATIRDLMRKLKLPALVVASTRLGTINHTLLTIEAIQRARVPVKGIVLVGARDAQLIHTLADFTKVPVIAHIPRLPRVTASLVKVTGVDIFTPNILVEIFGYQK